MSTALIIGVASQDGSYLAELLLTKKYQVIGTVRNGGDDLSNISRLSEIQTEEADLLDPDSLSELIKKYQPDEVYNLAALTVPSESWDKAYLVGQVTGLGPVTILESIRRLSPNSRFFQASSREIFGTVKEGVADERTAVNPENPYAAAKSYAHFMVGAYRREGVFACSGIMFNHDSPRRPPAFVVRKITSSVAQIKKGTLKELRLGDLASARDRGFAGDYVKAMWLILQNKTPKDYVVATNSLHSVQEICEAAFDAVGLNWKDFVVVDQKFIKKFDSQALKGDASLIKKDLGWHPETKFEDLIKMMVDSDLKNYK